ncbi:MAG: HIT domain-containing protein [Pseudomonadota bacterium]
MPDFEPDARLVEDSYPLTELPLCQLRLMDDARFPWLLLIPRRTELSEVFELDAPTQQQLWREATRVGRAVLDALGGDKLNIATLGNVVPQLHVHVIVRRRQDAAWPAPVWGHGQAEAYDLDRLADLRARILAEVEGLDLTPPGD